MSSVDRVLGLLKSALTTGEILKSLQADLDALSDDLVALARDHKVLSERVARLEGFIEGAAAASAAPHARRLPSA